MTLKTRDYEAYISCFHAHFGCVLLNGNLHIPWSGRSEDNELLDGSIEVAPEHPDYAEWLEAIQNKDKYFQEERERLAQARADRRAHYKEQKPNG